MTNITTYCKYIIFGYVLLTALPLFSETQTGYVRTIGRNGKPGQPISSVMIRVEGPSNMVMSDEQGRFSFTLHEATRDDVYRLASVKKSNYELLDKDLIGRACGFTAVPIEIVLVNLTEMQTEKSAMAERFERQYAHTYQQKIAELQAQYEARQITGEEYTAREEELTKTLDKMLSQIDALVDRYVHTDYDRLDSLDQLINAHIEQGEFDEAERLIRSKGSVEQRMLTLRERQQVQHHLEEATRHVTAVNEMDIQEIKRDLSLLVDIAEAHLRPDSAYYYLQKIYEVDPRDLKNLGSLIHMARKFDDEESSCRYLKEKETILLDMPHPDTIELISLYQWSIPFYNDSCIINGDTIRAIDYAEKQLNLSCEYYKNDEMKKASAYRSMARACKYKSDEAKSYYEQELACYNRLLEQDSTNMEARKEKCYVELKCLFDKNEEYHACIQNLYYEALRDPQKNDSIIKSILSGMKFQLFWGLDSEKLLREMMTYYSEHTYTQKDTLDLVSNVAFVMRRSKKKKSLYTDSCCNYALNLSESLQYTKNYTSLRYSLMELYDYKGDYDKIIRLKKDELAYTKMIYGDKSSRLYSIYKNMGEAYEKMEDIDNAINAYQHAISISPKIRSIFLMAYNYGQLVELCHKKGDYQLAITTLQAAQSIFTEESLQDIVNVHFLGQFLYKTGVIYQEMGDKKKAKEAYLRALKFYKEWDCKNWITEVESALASLKSNKSEKTYDNQ